MFQSFAIVVLMILSCGTLYAKDSQDHYILNLLEKQNGWSLYETHVPKLFAHKFLIQRIDFDMVEVGLGYGDIDTTGEIYKHSLDVWWSYYPDLVSIANAGPFESKIQNPTTFSMPLKVSGVLISSGIERADEKLMMLSFSGVCPDMECISIRPFSVREFESPSNPNILVGYAIDDPALCLSNPSDFTIVGVDDYNFSSPILYIVHVNRATLQEAIILLRSLGSHESSMMVITQGDESQFRSAKASLRGDARIFPIVLAVRKKVL